MFKRLLLTLPVYFSLATSAPASTVAVDKTKPTLVIASVIGDGNIIPVGREMLDLASKGKKEVQLIINSPGGSVTTGMAFLSLMDSARAKGLKVTCFVPQIAASMAYQILLHCDERHTLNNAFLLWHRARVNMGGGFMSPGVAVTAPMARQLADELQTLDDVIFSEILKYMGKEVEAAELARHFEAETLHLGVNVHKMAPKFITTHSSIDGLFETLLDEIEKKKKDQGPFDFHPNELIYITERVTVQ